MEAARNSPRIGPDQRDGGRYLLDVSPRIFDLKEQP